MVGMVSLMLGSTAIASAQTEVNQLTLVYPPTVHQTTADQIFLIGSAPPDGTVEVNGVAIDYRSPAGHFAPSIPLQLGENQITLTHGDQALTLLITRNPVVAPAPIGLAFGEGSLQPSENIVRQSGDLICFEAIAPQSAEVSVSLANQTIPLLPRPQVVLPPNYSVLTFQNQPVVSENADFYEGCAIAAGTGNLGTPDFRLSMNGDTISQAGTGTVTILSQTNYEIAEVIVESGIARTGPSTSYSRLTPLPQGTQATITGREGDWVRLDYGAWIRASEVTTRSSTVPVRSLIRSIQAHQREGWTDIWFPLQTPVPVTVQQQGNAFTLSLHNTTAQTDTILLNDDPLIERLDWYQPQPNRVDYTFQLSTDHQWGYTLAYEGTTLVLSLRHPPDLTTDTTGLPLSGLSILLDPGHGSDADLGARGPTGYPEKEVTLLVSNLLRDELQQRGATVYMTREGDEDLYPQDRVDVINEVQPAIALSIHYNALPDNGDALNTAGIGTFWYHAQAHDLSVFLHNYLVDSLDRPSYGVFWNNLALARPTVAPAVLLELGFMINPDEFEWIMDSQAQQQLAIALADGIVAWVDTAVSRQ